MIDLERQVDDLDLFVSEEIYNRLKCVPGVKEIEKRPKVVTLRVIDEVEIWENLSRVEYDRVKSRAKTTFDSHGLLVGALCDLVTWKCSQKRKKYYEDLKKMRAQTQLNQDDRKCC